MFMIELDIPGFGEIALEHLVMDYNGTLACDGLPVDGVKERFQLLAPHLRLHVITADTFGQVKSRLRDWECTIKILESKDQAREKLDYVKQLGAEKCASLGNGRNDRYMLEASSLGVAVMLEEGTAKDALSSADILLPGILSALDLFLNPLRLTAGLRS